MYIVAISLDDNLTIQIEECEKLLKYEDFSKSATK
jgi:hypothetical protein